MSYYLTRQSALKWLETPSVYQIAKDEVYELDNESFRFFRECSSDSGCASRDTPFIDYCVEEGLLTKEKVSIRRPPLVRASEPSLRYLELQITNACNLRCKHCYIGAGSCRRRGFHRSATSWSRARGRTPIRLPGRSRSCARRARSRGSPTRRWAWRAPEPRSASPRPRIGPRA